MSSHAIDLAVYAKFSASSSSLWVLRHVSVSSKMAFCHMMMPTRNKLLTCFITAING